MLDKKTKYITQKNYKGIRNPNYKFISKKELIKYAKNGLSMPKIAKIYNVSRQTIIRKLKLYNLIWKNISTFNQKGENNPNYNNKWSDEKKNILSKKLKGRKIDIKTRMKISESKKGKKFTDEHIKNLRLAKIKEIERKNGQIFPNYNKKACEFFEHLNETMNWKGKHAENGGEYHIKELGYWVDYYEPTLNLVIEWDEFLHFDKNGNLIEKDKIRQKEIEEFLGCRFIRIKEENFKYLEGVL